MKLPSTTLFHSDAKAPIQIQSIFFTLLGWEWATILGRIGVGVGHNFGLLPNSHHAKTYKSWFGLGHNFGLLPNDHHVNHKSWVRLGPQFLGYYPMATNMMH
jgi:hypothetical protein